LLLERRRLLLSAKRLLLQHNQRQEDAGVLQRVQVTATVESIRPFGLARPNGFFCRRRYSASAEQQAAEPVYSKQRLSHRDSVEARMRILVAVFGLLVGSIVLADDWPQFRGADRSGISKEKGLLKAWPKGGPTLAWTFKQAGMGHSSVAVVKGVVYTLGTDMTIRPKKLDKDGNEIQERDREEFIIAIDEEKGTQLWTVKLGPTHSFKGNIWGNGPRSTPTINGNLLYALSSIGELVCVDVTQKGKEVWRKNLAKDFSGQMMTEWGFSESPLVDGDRLLVTPGGRDGTVAALDKKTGDLLWRSKDWTDKAPYSSVIAADINGVRQFIQTGFDSKNSDGHLVGVDATNGNKLWSATLFKGAEFLGIASTPIVVGNQVYASCGGTPGGTCHLFEIDKKNNVTEKFAKGNLKKFKNAYGGVVLIDGHIYGHTEASSWGCQSLDKGAIEWTEREALSCGSGAITAAEGKLYLYSDDGEVGLMDATPNGPNLLSRLTLAERSKLREAVGAVGSASKTWAIPVIANGHLYLRDHELIFKYKITK
jgi:outer membrane protein assembly factor BamB